MEAFVPPTLAAAFAGSPACARGRAATQRRAARHSTVHMTLSAPKDAGAGASAGHSDAEVVLGGLVPGVVHEVSTPEQFDALLSAAGEDGLVVADFMAKWCRKCIYLKARLPKLALTHPKVYFATIDVNKVARLPREYKITKMPTFIFIRGDGTVLEEYIGAAEAPQVKAKLYALVEQYDTLGAGGSDNIGSSASPANKGDAKE